MRTLLILAAASTVAACSTAPPPPAGLTAEAQQKLNRLVAGKVPGQPVSCLPNRSADMIVINEDTIVFRAGGNRVFVNKLQGSCSMLGNGGYALVTRQFGDPRLCRGDIAHVTDVQQGMTVGTCAIGDFVPFTRP